ncbi:putative sodium-coupled neutral amino acid transporter 10 [Nilaparvata lugens]|uniref:putative sodium-coupled neutral amino acid transporter 10 n=1 Tax=Nilaparvata lugens TaxID=108931 RepID=UPI000B998D6B|nr:putative sodium-coupled neutral amino acid transporter 10 [Nilaparvata lugens]
MGTNGHVMTLANSIIGVSVLAMPFCFKQCGIMLSILVLLMSGVMTRLACHYLLKSAINARRRNFEILAFHTFGPTGKLIVELSIIGFMLGTCIAYFVVMGDLGPAIIGPVFNIDSTPSLRPSVLMGLGLLVVLPLGLLKNVDSLSTICTATIAFYLCLVLKVMAEATTHLLSWDWVDKVNLWRPAGISQCIPIFAMALSCQTQLFEVFDSVPNTPLDKMNAVVRSAVNMCTAVYISVGFFGYIAYCTQNFSGNLLMSFSPTVMSEIVKLGFVLSVAVSFPLVIFPCRASLHSLLFRRHGHTPHHELLSGGGNYIPELRFKCLTVCIVLVSLGTGLLIPSIEVVLGLVGSTIGIVICIIFPALTFICLSNKKNNERLLAQMLIGIGLFIMVLGTYSNLFATEEAITKPDVDKQGTSIDLNQAGSPQLPEEAAAIIKEKSEGVAVAGIPEIKQQANDVLLQIKKVIDAEDSDKRKEPPVPVAPGDNIVKDSNVNSPISSAVKQMKEEMEKENEDMKPTEKGEGIQKETNILKEPIKKNDVLIKEDQLKKLYKIEVNSPIKSETLEKSPNAEVKEIKKPKRHKEDVLKIMAKVGNSDRDQEKNVPPYENNKNNIDKEDEISNPKVNNIIKLDDTAKQNDEKSIKLSDTLKVPRQEIELKTASDTDLGNKKLGDNQEKNGVDITPDLEKNIIKGVPLPIAVRNNMNKNSVELDKPFLDIEADKQKIGGVRDILSEKEKFVKEEREKRDLETVEKEDMNNFEKDVVPEKPEVESTIDKQNVIEKEKSNSIKGEVEKPVEHKDVVPSSGSHLGTVDSEAKCSKDSKNQFKEDENGLQASILKMELKKIPQESEKDMEMPVTDKQVLQTSVEPLIKTPKFMSPPETVLNAVELKPEELIRTAQDVKPMSRDLKSVNNDQGNTKNTRQQDRITEIT